MGSENYDIFKQRTRQLAYWGS